jgi:AcrR family transcriptional regulator
MKATVARRRASRLPAEERRRQILDSAVGVFARVGYEAAGTADIARAAGIGEPTIYRYFSNKREVYLETVARASDEILEAWTRLADESPDALTALQRIGIWYFQRLQAHPELLLRSRSIAGGPQDDEITAVVRDAYRRVRAFVEQLFARAQRDGQIGAGEDIATYVWLFMAVGSLLDQAQMLGLDELTPEQVLKLAAMIQPSPPGQKKG